MVEARIYNFFLSKDIWSNLTTASSSSRSAAIGYSIIGGICSSKKYSIIEYSAFSIVQNAGHELGHRYNKTLLFVAFFILLFFQIYFKSRCCS